MRFTFLVLLVAIAAGSLQGQSYSSVVEVVTVYSANELFYLKSIPFDNESPSLRGETRVYKVGMAEPIYTLDRGFDSVETDSNNLVLSNDGEVIFYLIPWGADETKNGLKSISIYRKGKLAQSYSGSEISGCDLKKERCDLVYSNWEQVIDNEKSNVGTPTYKKAFKDGVSQEERFLSDFPIFSFDDSLYLTDSKKNTHRFSLKEGKYIGTENFAEVFTKFRADAKNVKVTLDRYNAPIYLDFPRLQTGTASDTALGVALGMTSTEDDEKFRIYRLKISGYLSKDGTFEIVELGNSDALPETAIREFFRTRKFTPKAIPSPIRKWWIEEYFSFRKSNVRVAMRERKLQLNEQAIESKTRLAAEEIDGRYIPKDLGDAFVELDKMLPEIDRKEISAVTKRDEMIQYHFGLGMWMRNNWGLWGGSRLQKYFTDKGMTHPDDMSSVILLYYWDWLKGDKEKWKNWERAPKQKLF